MFELMIIVFILGYIAIALEHTININKAATALIIGTLCWVIYIIGAQDILNMNLSSAWRDFASLHHENLTIEHARHFITEHEVVLHLGETAEILFFLLAAMTIVEMVDAHNGFAIITDRIKTTNKVKLLWIMSFLTFFMSALLDNLTTTIVMIALLSKLITNKHTRWLFASMVVLAANAGGAWSPIGDVTTIMLWIGGQVTTLNIMEGVFLPSLVSILVPLIILSFNLKGSVKTPEPNNQNGIVANKNEQRFMLALGVAGLLSVPVFKTVTHLPPYMGMLLALGVIWLISEILHRKKPQEIREQLSVHAILRKIDVPTILFFLGILSAVAALQSAGHLNLMADWLDKKLGNIYLIDLAIGVLSSIIDNVPLVAGAIGMYPIADAGTIGHAAAFIQDGAFWEFLAYTAGTGGSLLIIGSAAGVAAMGIEKIDFMWYLKKISWLALLGYLAGAAVYCTEFIF
ncbi:MAG: sodium:proton antiporter NhaD [Mangrovibacterium sp.]